jgi:hypothetical protein
LILIQEIRNDLSLEDVVVERHHALGGRRQHFPQAMGEWSWIGVGRSQEMVQVPDVPGLSLGATRERVDLLPDCGSRRIVVHSGHRNAVGPDDVRSGRLEYVLLIARSASAEFDLRMKWNGNASRLELELPPLGGICLLRFRDPNDFETLTGEQVPKPPAEQDLVKSFAEDMRWGSHGVEIEVFRAPSAAKPCTEIDPTLDDPGGSIHPSLHHPKKAQMETLDVLER